MIVVGEQKSPDSIAAVHPEESPPTAKHNIPTDSVPVAPIVRFKASRIEPDLDGVFLQNKASTTLGSAAARGDTDFHMTGCKRAVGLLLTSAPTTVVLTLDEHASGCFEKVTKSEGTTLYISNRTRLNITTSHIGVGIDGTVVDTMSGQASATVDSMLDVQMQRSSTVIPIVYANWIGFGAVIDVSQITFQNPKTGSDYDNMVVYNDDTHNQSCKRASAAMEEIYNQSVAIRNAVVFTPAPQLSKVVMRVPFGIDGSTYDLCSSVVSRPISLDRVSFESLMASTMRLETNGNAAKFQTFIDDCASPGITASRWSGAVANALSTFVSSICPYRIDGRTVLTPNGMEMTAAECWKAEAARTKAETADDCEGDAAHITAAVCDARLVALDKSLAAEFPVTARIANAMSLHFVGICVLAANAGNAGDAGKKGASGIAGHAISMGIPRSLAFEAMITGAMSSTQGRDAKESNALVESLKSQWHNAMFTPEELAAMPDEDVEVLKNADTFSKLHKDAAFGEMEVLAIEGTSPVSPSLLYSRDVQDRISRRRVARGDKKISALVGPTVARMITQLDVGASTVETTNVFYGSLVEFMLSPHEELFKNTELRKANRATSQFVICKPDDTRIAGVTPQQMATRNFALLSVWTIGSETAADLEIAFAEVQRNTIPMRSGLTTLDATTNDTYKHNINALRELNKHGCKDYGNSETNPIAQYIFAIATLIHNKHSVQVFVDKLRGLVDEKKVAVSIDIESMINFILDVDGRDVGKFVVVNVESLG